MSSNIENSNHGARSFLDNFAKKYIPTNRKTYNLGIAICGFALSCFSFGMFMQLMANTGHNPHAMYNYGFMVVAAACGIELYCGLQNRNSTQFAFWILLKLLEILAVLALTVEAFIFKRGRVISILDIFNLIVQLLLVIYVVIRAAAKDNRQNIPEENIYDVVALSNISLHSQPHYSNVS